MSTNRIGRTFIAAIAATTLAGGGLTAAAPAIAKEDREVVATKWKKVWKKSLRPLADQRYYTKSQTDAKYSTKTEVGAALGGYYTKAQSDGAYAAKTQSYTKAESDAKYLPKPALVRGTYTVIGNAAAGGWVGNDIQYGVTISDPPIQHYINVGAAVPAGCSGTAAAPNADPGHLCLFETQNINAGARTIFGPASASFTADTFGAGVYVAGAAAGSVFVYGSWALRPLAVVNPTTHGDGGGPSGAPQVP